MGFLGRLISGKDTGSVKVLVIGDAPEADRLAVEYSVMDKVELVESKTVIDADGIIRKPVVKAPGLDRFDELIATGGLDAVEICAPPDKRAGLAKKAIEKGLFTSVDPITTKEDLKDIETLAMKKGVALRTRLLPVYYPPYRELRRLADEKALGKAITLKLTTRRGKGTELPDNFDPAAWIRENELGFLAISRWFMGDLEKVHARFGPVSTNGTPSSSVITWKYKNEHEYGYFQLDICPELSVRTFHEPVWRQIEFTSIGGLIIANRGEGQLMRTPPLIVRGKSTTTAFEVVPDKWDNVYIELAKETVAHLLKRKSIMDTVELNLMALELIDSAEKSRDKKEEVGL